MLHRAIVLIFVLASIASLAGCGSTTSHYVFVTLPAANEVATYREDPNSGVLTEIAGSPFPAGNSATSAVIHPDGKYLYTANPGVGENDISLFSIASDGVLTEITPRTPVTPGATDPQNMVMDPGGKYLYVANATSNNLSAFSISGGTGAITALSASPFLAGTSPISLAVDPLGNFVYVTNQGSNNTSAYALGSDGILSALAGSPFAVGGEPSGVAVDPTGSFLYITNASSGNVSVFAIAADTGVLTMVNGSSYTAGRLPSAIAISD